MDIDEFHEKLQESGNEHEKKKYLIRRAKSDKTEKLWLSAFFKTIFLIAIPVIIAFEGKAVQMVTFFAVVITAYEFTLIERARKNIQNDFDTEYNKIDHDKIRGEYDYDNI